MIGTPEVINLQLYQLEELLLKYYKEKLGIENLKIESKIIKDTFQKRKIDFKLISRKEINSNMNINKEYTLEKEDIDDAINSYLTNENYQVSNWDYEFKEYTDDVRNIKLFVKKQKENKLKKILTRNTKGGK